MSEHTPWPFVAITPADLYRFTPTQFEHLKEVGFFGPDDTAELIDGLLVQRVPVVIEGDTSPPSVEVQG
jgi:hypothetical protein